MGSGRQPGEGMFPAGHHSGQLGLRLVGELWEPV